jgi:chromosome segregation ATPase
MTVIATGEHGLEEGERRAERDLGAIANEVEHLAAQLVDHTTTIDGIKEDKAWILQRFEAIERDLAAIPKLPEELTATFSESLANLTSRIERLEATATEPETRAPSRSDRTSDEEDRREEKRPNILDRLF